MGSQNSLEIEWSNHEIIPKEEEVFSFQHQLPPLDFRYPESECRSNYDIDATYFMDIISKNPLCSFTDILPDPTLSEDGLLVGRHDKLGFPDQMFTMNSLSFPNQMSTMNSLGFPDQEMSSMNSIVFPNQEKYMMNSFVFPNQEMSMMNTPGFSYQTQPAIMEPMNSNDEEETKIVTSGYEQPQTKGNNNGDNGNGDGGFDFNSSSRMALSKETISQYFYMPIDQAAKELNIGKTHLKKRCRELGIRRWPYRKLMSLQSLITNLQKAAIKSSGNGVEEKLRQAAVMRLENERKKLEEIPDLQLEDTTKRLRQACFKANYKKRKTIGKNSSTLTTYQQSPSSCSSTCVDYGGYEAMKDGYGGYEAIEDGHGGNHAEQEEMKSLLSTGYFSSSSNALI